MLLCDPLTTRIELGFSIGTKKHGSSPLGFHLHCRVLIPRFSPSYWYLAGLVPLLPFGLRLWLNATPHMRDTHCSPGKAFSRMLKGI